MAKADEWAARVAGWRRSGKTAASFSDGRGFNPKTLTWWASELRRRSRRTDALERGVVRFAKVVARGDARSVAAGGASIEIVVRGDRVVRVTRGFDAEVLAAVVDTLEGP